MKPSSSYLTVIPYTHLTDDEIANAVVAWLMSLLLVPPMSTIDQLADNCAPLPAVFDEIAPQFFPDPDMDDDLFNLLRVGTALRAFLAKPDSSDLPNVKPRYCDLLHSLPQVTVTLTEILPCRSTYSHQRAEYIEAVMQLPQCGEMKTCVKMVDAEVLENIGKEAKVAAEQTGKITEDLNNFWALNLHQPLLCANVLYVDTCACVLGERLSRRPLQHADVQPLVHFFQHLMYPPPLQHSTLSHTLYHFPNGVSISVTSTTSCRSTTQMTKVIMPAPNQVKAVCARTAFSLAGKAWRECAV